MTTQELIKQYRISLKLDEHGQPTGNLVVYRADKSALAAIKAAKPEIVSALLAQREAGLRAEQERQAKIAAISCRKDGIALIRIEMSFLYGLYGARLSVMPSRRRHSCCACASLWLMAPSSTQPCSMQCSNAASAAASRFSSPVAYSVTT